ncbi:hypothetical protein DKX38_024547 [Salix brachista]|uniref:Lipoxygenase domain-containing protein n=1 Tax=Salix brachista TaxID=2182728 RepID=A0A5N5JLM7_9ROSI|nr:hypothetical protein DKX38_024547 [Salix brachista]
METSVYTKLLRCHWLLAVEAGKIKALALECLINAGGIIESTFSPVEDPTAKHGLKLTTKDYPFANDGRILWAAVKQCVSDYVDHYYPETSMVKSDKELQAWWTEYNNRLTVVRTNMPTEAPSDEELKLFLMKPGFALLKCFPSQIQATKVMAVSSSHSPDEECIGQMEPSWEENPVIRDAFERLNARLKELGEIIIRGTKILT